MFNELSKHTHRVTHTHTGWAAMHQHPRRLARQQTPERDKEAAVSRPAGEDGVEDGDTSHCSRICSPPFLHQHNGGGLNYEDNARGVGVGGRTVC